MKPVWIVLIATLLARLTLPASDDLSRVREAFANKANLFSSDYLAYTLLTWQKKFGVTPRQTKIDQSQNHGNQIVIVEIPSIANMYKLRMSFDKDKKIQRIGRYVIPPEAWPECPSLLWHLLEKWIWLYDAGDALLLEDLMDKTRMTIHYQGESGNSKIVRLLRKQFPRFLPVHSFRTTHSGSQWMAEISPQTLQPITFNFELVDVDLDIVQQTQALIDSLKEWKSLPSDSTLLITPSSGYSGTLDSLKNDIFPPYTVSGQKDGKTWYHMSASLPVYMEAFHSDIKFSAECLDSTGMDSCHVKRINLVPLDLSLALKYVDSVKIDTIMSFEQFFTKIISLNLYRYRTMLLPDIFVNFPRAIALKKATVIVHGFENVHVDLTPVSFYSVLGKIGKDRVSYYEISDVSRSSDTLKCEGCCVLRSKYSPDHHMLFIHETYSFASDQYDLEKVTIHLYPYIRVDKILNLLHRRGTDYAPGNKMN